MSGAVGHLLDLGVDAELVEGLAGLLLGLWQLAQPGPRILISGVDDVEQVTDDDAAHGDGTQEQGQQPAGFVTRRSMMASGIDCAIAPIISATTASAACLAPQGLPDGNHSAAVGEQRDADQDPSGTRAGCRGRST